MLGNKIKFVKWLILGITFSCVDKYDPPVIDENLNLLVVNSYLDGRNGSAEVELLRSKSLKSEEGFVVEDGANVVLESENGDEYVLNENTPGRYLASNLTVQTGERYRLHITLSGESEYRSDFIMLKDVPPVKSLYWELQDDGIQIFLDTEGLANGEKFYRWTFHETYEYHSKFTANMSLVNGAFVSRPLDERVDICWRNKNSLDIEIYSTKNLVENKVNRYKLQFIPAGDIRLSQKYSIEVLQHTLSADAFEYWSNIKKTNESLGGLFDPIPFQVIGNIHNINDDNEPVIGYFDGSSVQRERIFIDNGDLSSKFYYREDDCEEKIVYFKNPGHPEGSSSFVINAFSGANSTAVVGYVTADLRCVDCTLKGGTTTKPDYWE